MSWCDLDLAYDLGSARIFLLAHLRYISSIYYKTNNDHYMFSYTIVLSLLIAN